MSVKPIAWAWVRPRSTRRSLTQRSRRRSVARAMAGVPAGPMRERASALSLFRISGRLDSSSTGPRKLDSTSASCRQLSPGSRGGSSRTIPRSIPPTNAVETFGGGTPRARADGQVDARDVGNRPEALLDKRLAEKAGAAGDQDGLALEGIGDHDGLSLVVGLSVIQMWDLHHRRPRGIGPAEVGGRVGPKPVALAGLALKRHRAVAARGRQYPADRILRDNIDGKAHAAGAGPGDGDRHRVVQLRVRAQRHAWHLDRGVAR